MKSIKKEELNKILDDVYKDIDGFQLSQTAINKLPFYDVSFRYEAITYNSFLPVLEEIKSTKHKIFYDLGSGIGEKVLISALFCNFSKCIGIELLDNLFRSSLQAKIDLLKKIKYMDITPANIDFFHADFNSYDFSDGDVFFLSLPLIALSIELKGDLGKRLNTIKKGAKLITTGAPIISSHYILQHHFFCQFSDRAGDIFISERI